MKYIMDNLYVFGWYFKNLNPSNHKLFLSLLNASILWGQADRIGHWYFLLSKRTWIYWNLAIAMLVRISRTDANRTPFLDVSKSAALPQKYPSFSIRLQWVLLGCSFHIPYTFGNHLSGAMGVGSYVHMIACPLFSYLARLAAQWSGLRAPWSQQSPNILCGLEKNGQILFNSGRKKNLEFILEHRVTIVRSSIAIL